MRIVVLLTCVRMVHCTYPYKLRHGNSMSILPHCTHAHTLISQVNPTHATICPCPRAPTICMYSHAHDHKPLVTYLHHGGYDLCGWFCFGFTLHFDLFFFHNKIKKLFSIYGKHPPHNKRLFYFMSLIPPTILHPQFVYLL